MGSKRNDPGSTLGSQMGSHVGQRMGSQTGMQKLATLPEDESTRKVVFRRQGPDRKIVLLTLRVVAGRDMLRFVTLQHVDEVSIGRDENGALVLTDASVSRRHALVTCTEDGRIYVEDLGSTNGTAVNGRPVKKAEIRPGDHLEIGVVSLRLDLLSLVEVEHLQSVLHRLEANNRDPLTGLLNRAWLDEELPEYLEQASRVGVDYACLFLDIDHFKSVNDRFGHQVGDEVLVGVARLLMVGVRETDACVRFGGEELLMLLHGTNEALALEVAERVRESIEKHDWARTIPGLEVTASIGISNAQRNESVRDWIKRADRALYAAKAAGRNRVVSATTLT